jgi:digeranylgeranylglycerophospholipid reductase
VNKDKDVLVMEKRSCIGGKGCSGGISSWLLDEIIGVLGLKEIKGDIVSEVNKVKIISPSGNEVKIDGKEIGITPLGYIFDRVKLDKHLGEIAERYGVDINVSERVIGYKCLDKGIKVKTDRGEYECRYVVGADGVFTVIGKQSGLVSDTGSGDIHTAVEYYIKRPETEEPDEIVLRYDDRYAPGGYVWHFPHGDDIIKVGCGVPVSIGNPRKYLDKYVSKYFPSCSKLKTVGGCLPTAKPLPRVVSGRIALVGDAGRMCDPLTGGGIANGMGCGVILGEVIGGDRTLTEYNTLFNKKYRTMLMRRYKLKKVLYGLTAKDIDNIADTLSRYKVSSSNPRVEITKAMIHIILRHPKVMWRYAMAR